MLRCAFVLFATGCSFPNAPLAAQPGDGGGPDTGSGNQVDDASPFAFMPLHVPPAGRAPGTGDLTLTGPVDTSALTIGTQLPAGVTFDVWTQSSSSVALAVLHVRTLTIPTSAIVRVTGARAFVVIASGEIQIAGTLDAGGKLDTPGAGGANPDSGAGAGNPGQHTSTYKDSGGSGAGFANGGGTGGAGSTSCNPYPGTVSAGTSYGTSTLSVLVGGSGGGTAYLGTCGVRPGGAGGGAIQLSSASRVAVSGNINAGGGGGGGGRTPIMFACNMTAGSGGGSGGAIVLQAPRVELAGVVAANGGAGGSSAGDVEGDNVFPSAQGIDGQNGQLSATPATPGSKVGVWSSAGGAGGAASIAPVDGVANADCDGNGGGGGGSVGRIVVALQAVTGTLASSGIVSPPLVQMTY